MNKKPVSNEDEILDRLTSKAYKEALNKLDAMGLGMGVARKVMQFVGTEQAVNVANMVLDMVARRGHESSLVKSKDPEEEARKFLRWVLIGISYDYGKPGYPIHLAELFRVLEYNGIELPDRASNIDVEQFLAGALCILTDCEGIIMSLVKRLVPHRC